MARFEKLLSRLPARERNGDEMDLALGLPLDAGGRRIYPVLRDPRSAGANGDRARQIGYLELTDTSADFISLERDKRALLTLIAVVILSMSGLWFFLRRRT